MSQLIKKIHICRLLMVILCVVLLFSNTLIVHANGESGDCGDNLTWSLNEGTLTISGSGAMWDFPESTMAPWYELREEIRSVVLPDKLTHIGELAFYDCYRLTTVNLPDKVETIGEFAFASCEKLQMLDLCDGLLSIGESAFHGCWELLSVRLPGSLQTIEDQAFYDCSSIDSVVIPASVTNLGTATFAYCTSLVRAEIQTEIKNLPEWTFFGCSKLSTLVLPSTIKEIDNAALRDCNNLHTVSYGGSSMTTEQLMDVVDQDIPGFSSTGVITPENPGASASAGSGVEHTEGSLTEQITTVIDGTNSAVSSTVDRTFGNSEGDTISTNITVTVENEDGWDEAIENVLSSLEDMKDRVLPELSIGTSHVTVYVKDTEEISRDFVEALAGKDVIMTVVSKDGSSWKIDCSTMKEKDLSGKYNLSYTVETADDTALALMGVTEGYCIRFTENAEVEAEVLILLPDSAINQAATFFRKDGLNNLTRFQSVLVDNEGYAHLYLGSVKKGTDYYLGINAPIVDGDGNAVETNVPDTIIPDTMEHAYPKMDYKEPIQYEITGRSSSWGMNLGQVMGILAGVMVGVIALVGVIMYIWNKSRAKEGYAPGLEDLDDEDDITFIQ